MAKAKTTNQQILLVHVLEQERQKRAPELSAMTILRCLWPSSY
jgi:hypothetical protein